jgi:hypothetical protein
VSAALLDNSKAALTRRTPKERLRQLGYASLPVSKTHRQSAVIGKFFCSRKIYFFVSLNSHAAGIGFWSIPGPEIRRSGVTPDQM